MVTCGTIFNWKARQGAITVSIAKTHCLKHLIQAPLPGQALASALMFLVSIKPYDLFGLMLYMIHKIKVGQKGIRLCNTKIWVVSVFRKSD